MLDCSCKCPCTFPIKTILCENTNIPFSKNHGKLGKMNACFLKNI